MLIADDTGLVGGLNIATEYASLADGGMGWRDTMVKISSPAVSELVRLFLDLWERPQIRHGSRGELCFARQALGCEIAAEYRAAVNSARRTVWIANPYFLPSASFRRALRKAAKNGVDVRIMVPARSDVSPVLWAAQCSYERYLQWGIRLFEWTGPALHAKMAVIDGEWSTVESFNLDHQSLLHNLEITVVVVDRTFGHQVEAVFKEDFSQCRELFVATWRARGLDRQLRERWWAIFRMLL